LVRGQAVRPGDVIVTSRLLLPVAFTTGGGTPVPYAEIPIRSTLPFALWGMNARSAYSTATSGFRLFDIRNEPADIVRVLTIVERKPTLSFLPMHAPEAAFQIVSGMDRLEEGRYRWMGKRAVLLLKKPEHAAPLEVELYLPESAAARRLTIEAGGKQLLSAALDKPGLHKLATPPFSPAEDTVTVAIEVDRTFQVAGDLRTLGVILVAAGFRE
jgi:hypothetical protein